MTYSSYQLAIFDRIASTSDSIAVDARAGAAKSTTIVHGLPHIRMLPGDLMMPPTLFCAFNKDIVTNLKGKLPTFVNCSTFNSMGYRSLLSSLPNKPELVANKCGNILKGLITPDNEDYRTILQLVGLSKSRFARPEDQSFEDLAKTYGLILTDPSSLKLAKQVAVKSLSMTNIIDFNDQLYMPAMFNTRLTQYSYVFVDERQDVNSIQVELIRRSLKPSGRLIAVGDPKQAIYGFRGASMESMQELCDEFHCVTMPLSICYRCSKAVVAEAQKLVPDILPWDQSPEGSVTSLPEYLPSSFPLDSAILCRNAAPLITMAYGLLKRDIPARVLGRDIGASLIAIVKKMHASDLPNLIDRLDLWKGRELERAFSEGNEYEAERITDQHTCLKMFIDNLDESSRSIPDLLANIELLFSERSSGVTLATIHKSKGLEWPTVFILDRNLMPSRFATLPWQREQERNLQYVAITRAQVDLVYINSGCFKLS